jgi:hypothetical protein
MGARVLINGTRYKAVCSGWRLRAGLSRSNLGLSHSLILKIGMGRGPLPGRHCRIVGKRTSVSDWLKIESTEEAASAAGRRAG